MTDKAGDNVMYGKRDGALLAKDQVPSVNERGNRKDQVRRYRLLFVGAFPPAHAQVFGGNVTDCRALLASSFAQRFDLQLLDSTQEVPPPPIRVRLRRALARIWRLITIFKHQKPDAMLVFASGGFSFIEKALMVGYARLRGVPSLLSVRSGHFIDLCRRSRVYRAICGVLLRFPRFLICQGRAWQTFFDQVFGLNAERCPIVDAWVATEAFLDIGKNRKARSTGCVEILFVGRIERFKGVFELLAAVRDLAAEDLPYFRLTLAGDGNNAMEAKSWVAQHGLSDRVRLVGWVDGEAKLALFRDADVFVLPSYTEGLPNAMIEAMAAGLPVVVTPVGSVPDVVSDGVQGLLVEPRSVQALTAALRKLLRDREARMSMGRSAHLTAQERFGTETAARRLAELVTRAIAPS